MKNSKTIRMTLLATAMTAACSWATAQEITLYESHVLPEGLIFEPVDAMGMQASIDMIIKGPNDFHLRRSFEAGEPIEFNPAALGQGSMPDGTYRYELQITGISGLAADRDSGKPAITESLIGGYGAFSIRNGSLVAPDLEEAPFKGGTAPVGTLASSVQGPASQDESDTRDQVIADDLIVDGSACIGFDCVNGESFGFDTLRLKENNLRIKFDDTSSSASFPNRDWQLTANDSSNGGQNKFSIDDITGGRTPFTIEAGARSHSLYVDDGGRIGMGTMTPVVEAHIVDGDTPTIRLEQDGSSGFGPLTWDIAGNETNFFVRDVSNGSLLPFRIFPGSPSSSLVVRNGNVGMGTASPAAPIDIRAASNIGAGNSALRASNDSGAVGLQLDPNNDGTFWLITANSDNDTFRINRNGGTGNVEFEIEESTGNLTIEGEIITGGTTCGGGCDYVFTDQYALPTIEEHAKAMWDNGYLPNVGPTVENQPFNLTDKTGRMLNELETAHIYIEQLHRRLAKLETRLEELDAR